MNLLIIYGEVIDKFKYFVTKNKLKIIIKDN